MLIVDTRYFSEFEGKKESRIKTIKVYFYDKYSEATQKEIAEKLFVRNRMAVAQRLKRFKEELKNNKKLKDKIVRIENKL